MWGSLRLAPIKYCDMASSGEVAYCKQSKTRGVVGLGTRPGAQQGLPGDCMLTVLTVNGDVPAAVRSSRLPLLLSTLRHH